MRPHNTTASAIVRGGVRIGTAVLVAVLGAGVIVPPAVAQGRWEVEVHVGGMLGHEPERGTAALPPSGTPFTTVVGTPSRRESSWYFGDGAALLNQVTAARGAGARITALDAVLNRAVARRSDGVSLGVRVSRSLTPRYVAEFNLDYSHGPLRLTDAALAGIEASRASFLSVFSVPLPPGPAGLTPVLTASSTGSIDRARGRQVLATGGLTINLRTNGRVIPYTTLGGGVLMNGGGAPTATLTGAYQISAPPGSPLAGRVVHDEADGVTIRYVNDDRTLVGVLGGGVKYAFSSRWGVRLDVRAHLSAYRASTRVDANPSVATLTPPSVLAIRANPTIQLSNNPLTGAPSSLSGPEIAGFETFRGRGTRVQINIVPGLFWRF